MLIQSAAGKVNIPGVFRGLTAVVKHMESTFTACMTRILRCEATWRAFAFDGQPVCSIGTPAHGRTIMVGHGKC